MSDILLVEEKDYWVLVICDMFFEFILCLYLENVTLAVLLSQSHLQSSVDCLLLLEFNGNRWNYCLAEIS